MAANQNTEGLAAVNIVVGVREAGQSVVVVPPGKGSKEFWKKVVRNQFTISLMGLYSGLAAIVIGIVLLVNGILGGGAWMAEAFGITISDAGPGVVLFFIGLGMAQVTKFKVQVVRTSRAQDTNPADPNPAIIDGVVIVGRNAWWRFGVEVPGGDVDEDFWTLVVQYQFQYSIVGFIGGILNIVAGVMLFLNGTIGTSHWSADVLGIKLTDAAPGTVLFFVGLGFLHLTQYVVKIGETRPRPNPGPLPPMSAGGDSGCINRDHGPQKK